MKQYFTAIEISTAYQRWKEVAQPKQDESWIGMCPHWKAFLQAKESFRTVASRGRLDMHEIAEPAATKIRLLNTDNYRTFIKAMLAKQEQT